MDWEDILKLSIPEKCQHKSWKARLEGYEEILTLTQEQCDKNSEAFSIYAELLQKCVVDNNAVAQEKGLEAVLYFVENATCAPATVKSVMSGLVRKCFSSPKIKIRELALKIALMYVKVGEKDAVSEELIEGLKNKSPRVVVTSLVAVQKVIRAFGPRVISVISLVKVLIRLLEDRDKSVREESKKLCVELYGWIGDDFIIQLQSLRPIILTKLKCAFRNTRELPVPTRSAIPRQKKKIDLYNLMTAVDVLSLLTNNFYKQCDAEKWRDRKEGLEFLLQITTNVKIASGDYHDLVGTLTKTIGRDCNISVVTLAIKCLRNLVLGLRTRFRPYASECVPTIFYKFKEKKQKVVVALREAIDAIYGISSFDVMLEDIQSALDSKNPQVRAETCAFLTRCFYTCSAAQLNARLLRALTQCLLNTLSDAHAEVRENSAEALGIALKVAGKSTTFPFLSENNAIKMGKVKNFYDKAIVTAKSETVVRKSSSLLKHLPPNRAMRRVKSEANYDVLQTAASNSNVEQKLSDVCEPEGFTNIFRFVKNVLTGDSYQQIPSEVIPSEVIEGVSSTISKDRLYFLEIFLKKVQQLEKGFIPANSCIQILAKKPGFRDSNFGSLKLRFETLIYIAKNAKISRVAVDSCLFDVVNKIGDVKVGEHAASALTVLSEATSLEYISLEVLKIVFSQRNPKNQVGALIWLSTAIKQLGLQIQVEEVIEYAKEAFSSDNTELRTAVLALFGTMHMYVGKFLCTFYKKESSVL